MPATPRRQAALHRARRCRPQVNIYASKILDDDCRLRLSLREVRYTPNYRLPRTVLSSQFFTHFTSPIALQPWSADARQIARETGQRLHCLGDDAMKRQFVEL